MIERPYIVKTGAGAILMVERLLIGQGDACRQLGIGRLTLIAEIEAGRLRYVLVGKRRRFKPGDLDDYIRRQGAGMRRKRSLVIKREGSTNFYESFTVNGHRFRRSLGTDDQETAEILAAKIRSDALLGKLTGKLPEHTLTQALARYWLEHGQYLPSAGDVARMGVSLQRGIGKSVLLSEIAASDLATYAWK